MKKIYLFLFYYFSLIFLEFIFAILSYDSILRTSIINILLFMLPISGLLTIITSIFNDIANKKIAYVLFAILGFWYNLYYVFNAIFDTQFSLSVLKLSDQGLKFAKTGIICVLQHFYGVILLFLPLAILIIFRNKLNYKRIKLKELLIIISIIIVSTLLFIFNIESQKSTKYSIYDLYHNINDNSLNIEKLGVLNATIMDIDRTIRGFEEKVIISNKEEKPKEEEIINYGYNELQIDYNSLLTKSTNNELKTITNYMINDSSTNKSKYTGIFKDKNLIYITAESFSEIAVSEELTPTLYKLIHSGFDFTNYYSSNNLSTIGGEFQSLTGLYANSAILPTWRSGKNAFPYGLSNVFENIGYSTYAYHNHYATFQDRNKYLKSIGFDNYLACYNGLEKKINCKSWPESDVEMINATVSDYINNDTPFMTYYMTVSGHFAYNWGNKMSKKHKSMVDNLPYSEPVKAYIATQIELDQALESLINELTNSGKLDDTVIVLLCDHYPYGLTLDQINEVSSYKRDSVVEINSNSLIIWNNKIKPTIVDKVAMSIDVIPTIYNLFGIEYDSKLFMGKDIFSDTQGLAFFKNRSWVTNKGTYFSTSGKITNNSTEVEQEYIDNINNIVANRMNISKLIIKTNYYNFINK